MITPVAADHISYGFGVIPVDDYDVFGYIQDSNNIEYFAPVNGMSSLSLVDSNFSYEELGSLGSNQDLGPVISITPTSEEIVGVLLFFPAIDLFTSDLTELQFRNLVVEYLASETASPKVQIEISLTNGDNPLEGNGEVYSSMSGFSTRESLTNTSLILTRFTSSESYPTLERSTITDDTTNMVIKITWQNTSNVKFRGVYFDTSETTSLFNQSSLQVFLGILGYGLIALLAVLLYRYYRADQKLDRTSRHAPLTRISWVDSIDLEEDVYRLNQDIFLQIFSAYTPNTQAQFQIYQNSSGEDLTIYADSQTFFLETSSAYVKHRGKYEDMYAPVNRNIDFPPIILKLEGLVITSLYNERVEKRIKTPSLSHQTSLLQRNFKFGLITRDLLGLSDEDYMDLLYRLARGSLGLAVEVRVAERLAEGPLKQFVKH